MQKRRAPHPPPPSHTGWRRALLPEVPGPQAAAHAPLPRVQSLHAPVSKWQALLHLLTAYSRRVRLCERLQLPCLLLLIYAPVSHVHTLHAHKHTNRGSMDHHCPWTGNCVGHANYRAFLLLLIYAVVALWHATGLLLSHAAHALRALRADRVVRWGQWLGQLRALCCACCHCGKSLLFHNTHHTHIHTQCICTRMLALNRAGPAGKVAAHGSGIFWSHAILEVSKRDVVARGAWFCRALPLHMLPYRRMHAAYTTNPPSVPRSPAGGWRTGYAQAHLQANATQSHACKHPPPHPQGLALCLALPAAVALSNLLSFHIRMVRGPPALLPPVTSLCSRALGAPSLGAIGTPIG